MAVAQMTDNEVRYEIIVTEILPMKRRKFVSGLLSTSRLRGSLAGRAGAASSHAATASAQAGYARASGATAAAAGSPEA